MGSRSKIIPACSLGEEGGVVAWQASTFRQPAFIHVFTVALSTLHLLQTIADATASELDKHC